MAVHDFKSQRLYVDAQLSSDTRIELGRDQANYLLNVLRMENGAGILVFNGQDGEWTSSLVILGRKKCSLVVGAQNREQPQPSRLVYCFAPLKQARLDYMIQKAVEMGAGVLQPVITQHTQVRNINQKRMHANVIEAAEQCGILNIPEIREPVALKKLPDLLPAGCHLVFCDENAARVPLAPPSCRATETYAVLIGPEGGFSIEERDFLALQENVIPLGLGPRILRADTAAVAALAIVQSAFGDWYTGNDRQ